MKKFEPHYRLVRVGMATKKERASRQQRTFTWRMMGRVCERPETDDHLQASNARTVARRSVVLPRRALVPRTRARRNRRLVYLPSKSSRHTNLFYDRVYVYIWRQRPDVEGGGACVEDHGKDRLGCGGKDKVRREALHLKGSCSDLSQTLHVLVLLPCCTD